ncbi:MAG: methylenetetrahydrofolate reductase C-terminal domain-containing protein [Dehalococcoidales bacterium]|nr:methylenetetrahydrofolate reductase C-terminal domain-containing protein [Dehalococcoidales bacterium]
MSLEKAGKILVISSNAGLTEIIKKTSSGAIEISDANGETGMDTARKTAFDLIALGYLEPAGTLLPLYRKLRDSWITRNTPKLVVDFADAEPSKRAVLPEETGKIPAADYVLLTNATTLAPLFDKVRDLLAKRGNPLKEAILNPAVFAVTWEQIPGRGALEASQEEAIENTRRAVSKGKGKIHGVSVTDNPGGNPAISTEMLCAEIKKLGIEPLAHIALRDKNRNEVESLLSGLAANGVRNLLMLTGDFPETSAFNSKPKPVFDLDSVQALQLVEKMNQGIEYENMGKKAALKPTDFFAGAAISPFKAVESELMGQYFKLKKKIEAGAKFAILQVGYDARKMHEVLTWLKVNQYQLPLIANIYVLPYGAAKTMNAGNIPGCVVTDKLLKQLDEERAAKDKGKQARLDRAAKMYAIAKGMGYAGAHIGGHGIGYDTVDYIVTKGEELSNKWQELLPEFDFPQKDGFYLYERDDKTGLNTEKPSVRMEKGMHPAVYMLSRGAHATLFNPKSLVFKSLRPMAKGLDGTNGGKGALERAEHAAKAMLFGCQNCGDCGLFDVAFLCPLSQCPKNQRNGPCGGSLNGWCEVYPNERQCIWVRAYDRLKAHKKELEIAENTVPPNDWTLQNTSSWLNFYLGRDHTAKRLGIKPPEKKAKKEEKK